MLAAEQERKERAASAAQLATSVGEPDDVFVDVLEVEPGGGSAQRTAKLAIIAAKTLAHNKRLIEGKSSSGGNQKFKKKKSKKKRSRKRRSNK